MLAEQRENPSRLKYFAVKRMQHVHLLAGPCLFLALLALLANLHGDTEGLTITRWKPLNLPLKSMTPVMSATLSFLTQSSACASLCIQGRELPAVH